MHNYDSEKTAFLVQGFSNGFDLGYRGSFDVQQKSNNLKYVIGDEIELWNKVMKEVKAKRYVGPFKEPPFRNFIQSPLGLVPKDGGKATRLIFHLSYPRLPASEQQRSVNANTPENLTTVQYPDVADAVRLCLLAGCGCKAAKLDMKSAFRHYPIHKKYWCLLVMKAKNPKDGIWYYFSTSVCRSGLRSAVLIFRPCQMPSPSW